jgi:hypothetical protein
VYLMFCVRPHGAWLALAALITFATLAIELADVLCENDSRRDLGGLTPAEYAMHFMMSALRAGFVGAFFGPVALADFSAPSALAPGPLATLGWTMVVPGIAVAALHVALCFTPLDDRAAVSAPARTPLRSAAAPRR